METLLLLAAVAGGREAVGGGLSGLAAQFSDESAFEVCIHVMRYTSRRLLLFLLFTFLSSYHRDFPPPRLTGSEQYTAKS